LFVSDTHERANHTYGKAERDLIRARRAEFPSPPDLVAFPQTEEDVSAILEWCSDERIAAIPYGGGSSVVGGTEPQVDESYRGTVSIDLARLDRVLEIDTASRSALIEGGIFGPALEAELKPKGLTLRHFPQSFEFSTLGGWIATRSGGHFATLFTHIDEFVQSLRIITPAGVVETRRLPGSGAGPSPDRFFLGSEGTLGVITQAWMRLQDRPQFRAAASVEFTSYEEAVGATRAVSQSGLYPANCRLLDHNEALLSGSGDGSSAVLIVGFESAHYEVGDRLDLALDLCRSYNGRPIDAGAGKQSEVTRDGVVGAWREAFIRLPHRHDALSALGIVSGSFESAITWDRFADFHDGVRSAIERALDETCDGGVVSCRFAYVYPDGPAPYYTIIGPGREGQELEQWDAIKEATSDAIMSHGGTITHHHAVGRDHVRWYELERPPLFAEVLKAAKQKLDPADVLNPGVLLPSAEKSSGV
jgi:alkyldihydroxyacetonephosphate synthase